MAVTSRRTTLRTKARNLRPSPSPSDPSVPSSTSRAPGLSQFAFRPGLSLSSRRLFRRLLRLAPRRVRLDRRRLFFGVFGFGTSTSSPATSPTPSGVVPRRTRAPPLLPRPTALYAPGRAPPRVPPRRGVSRTTDTPRRLVARSPRRAATIVAIAAAFTSASRDVRQLAQMFDGARGHHGLTVGALLPAFSPRENPRAAVPPERHRDGGGGVVDDAHGAATSRTRRCPGCFAAASAAVAGS